MDSLQHPRELESALPSSILIQALARKARARTDSTNQRWVNLYGVFQTQRSIMHPRFIRTRRIITFVDKPRTHQCVTLRRALLLQWFDLKSRLTPVNRFFTNYYEVQAFIYPQGRRNRWQQISTGPGEKTGARVGSQSQNTNQLPACHLPVLLPKLNFSVIWAAPCGFRIPGAQAPFASHQFTAWEVDCFHTHPNRPQPPVTKGEQPERTPQERPSISNSSAETEYPEPALLPVAGSVMA